MKQLVSALCVASLLSIASAQAAETTTQPAQAVNPSSATTPAAADIQNQTSTQVNSKGVAAPAVEKSEARYKSMTKPLPENTQSQQSAQSETKVENPTK